MIDFISRKEICEELQMSIDTFQAWVRMGLPEYRIGRVIMVKRTEFNHWVEAHGTAAIDSRINAMLEAMQ